MNELDKKLRMLNFPRPLDDSDLSIFEKFDAKEHFEKWASKAVELGIQHANTLEWNPPRRPFVLHPSSVDNPCDFFLYLQMISEPGKSGIPESLRMVLDTGTAIHGQFQYYQESRANHFGYTYLPEIGFKAESNLNAKVLKMSGHADGISVGWPLRAPLLWEYKTISKAGFEKLTSPHRGYVKQTHLYMLALGVAAVIIVYICKDNSQIKPFKVQFSEEVWRPLLERIFHIRQCAFELKDPEKRIGSGCHRCEFLEECKPDLTGVRQYGRLPGKI